MDYKKIGDFLKDLRTKENLTQEELGNKINISRQAISRWERGISIPDYITLLDLSKLYNVTVKEILYGKYIRKNTLIEYLSNERNKIIKSIVILIFSIIILIPIIYTFNYYKTTYIYELDGNYNNEVIISSGKIILTNQNYIEIFPIIKFSDKNINPRIDIIKENICYLSSNKEKCVRIDNTRYLEGVESFDKPSNGYYINKKDLTDMEKTLYLELTLSNEKEYKVPLQVRKVFSK